MPSMYTDNVLHTCNECTSSMFRMYYTYTLNVLHEYRDVLHTYTDYTPHIHSLFFTYVGSTPYIQI